MNFYDSEPAKKARISHKINLNYSYLKKNMHKVQFNSYLVKCREINSEKLKFKITK